jgi:hypothetical protein
LKFYNQAPPSIVRGLNYAGEVYLVLVLGGYVSSATTASLKELVSATILRAGIF